MTKRGVSLAVVSALLAAAVLAVIVFFAVRKDEKQVQQFPHDKHLHLHSQTGYMLWRKRATHFI